MNLFHHLRVWLEELFRCEKAPKKTNPRSDECARALLIARGAKYDSDFLAQTLDATLQSYDFNNKLIQCKIRSYKGLGAVLMIGLPIISAITAGLASMDQSPESGLWVKWLSIAVTAGSTFGVSLRPAVRFESSCKAGLELFHWRCRFMEGLAVLAPLDEKGLVQFVGEMRKELKELSAQGISLYYFPESMPC